MYYICEDYVDDLTAYRCLGGIRFRKARAVDHCLASLQLCKLFRIRFQKGMLSREILPHD